MFAFKHPLVYECDKRVHSNSNHVHVAGFTTFAHLISMHKSYSRVLSLSYVCMI